MTLYKKPAAVIANGKAKDAPRPPLMFATNTAKSSPPARRGPAIQRQSAQLAAGHHWPPVFQPNAATVPPPIAGHPVVQRQTSQLKAGHHWPPVFQPNAGKVPPPIAGHPVVQRQTSQLKAGHHWPPVFQPNAAKVTPQVSGHPVVQRQISPLNARLDSIPQRRTEQVQTRRVVQRMEEKYTSQYADFRHSGDHSSDNSGGLAALAIPKVFPGPAVEVQNELLARLERMEALPLESDLGAVLLPPDLPPEKDALIKGSRLIPTPRGALSRRVDIYDRITPDTASLIVRNTIETMIAAGQIQYLSTLTNEGDWRVVVEVHYISDRPQEMFGFHKDTRGETLFVNLSYITEHEIAGPEYHLNPPVVPEHDELIRRNFPGAIYGHIVASQTSQHSNIVNFTAIPKYGVVAFADELIHHATPLVGHRMLSHETLVEAIRVQAQKTGIFPEWFNRLAFKDDDQYSRPDFTAAGATEEEIDEVLSHYDPKGDNRFPFEKVSIPLLPESKKLVPIRQENGPFLKREASDLALKKTLPKPVTGKRRFFRTWVRVVPTEDIALTLLTKGNSVRAAAKTLMVKKRYVRRDLLGRFDERFTRNDMRARQDLQDLLNRATASIQGLDKEYRAEEKSTRKLARQVAKTLGGEEALRKLLGQPRKK